MNSGSTRAPIGELLADAERVLAAVVDAGFAVLCGPGEAVEFARAAERVGRLASAAATAAASALERSRAFVEFRVRDTAAVLTTMCRVERAEAVRRVSVADMVGDRATLTGEVLPPVVPALRDAIVAGEVSGRSAHQVASTFTKIDAVLTESSRDALTAVLIEAAQVEDDAFVRTVAKRVLIDANPDGAEPSAATLRLRQGITFGVEHGGLVPFSGAMTSLQYETVLTTIGVFTNPRLQQPDDADANGAGGERAATGPRFVELYPSDGGASIRVPVGDRTRAQLLLDGLVASCELAARTGKLPRNGGCAFPNCDLPAPWTDGHHIQHWADGGETSLDNGVLLCRAHHTLIHTTEWRITMIDRIPYFVPPWQVDAHQVPRRNLLRHRPVVDQRAKPRVRG